jgi:nucleoside-diphosphate-sugar epimerase
MLLRNKKILIIGGTGFVGSRLTEKLVLGHQAQVTVMSRDYRRASSIARYPVKLVKGNVTNVKEVQEACDGQEIVIDCTYPSAGTKQERTKHAIQGAEALTEATLNNRITRLVHLSTISVYGTAKDGFLDETQVCNPSGDAYGDSKLACEQTLMEAHSQRNLPVTILQPTVIYGPFAGWSIGPLHQLKQGRVALPNAGQGNCNAVYIDDVVQAIILACTSAGTEGERFLISGESPVTWKEYYEAYQAIAGGELALLSNKELNRNIHKIAADNRPTRRLISEFRNNAELRQLFLGLPGIKDLYGITRKMLPQKSFENVKKQVLGQADPITPYNDLKQKNPLILPNPNQISLFSAKAHVKIDKAKRMLGYQPKFDLHRGMKFTAQWAKWANLC